MRPLLAAIPPAANFKSLSSGCWSIEGTSGLLARDHHGAQQALICPDVCQATAASLRCLPLGATVLIPYLYPCSAFRDRKHTAHPILLVTQDQAYTLLFLIQ